MTGSPDLSLEERRRIDLELADQCRLNGLWLLGKDRRERALEILVEPFSLRPGLAAMYQATDTVPIGDPWTSGRDCRLPFEDGRFDAVALYGHWPAPHLRREIRRVLRQGGTALIAFENRLWAGRLRSLSHGRGAGFGGVAAERSLLAAGFHDARSFWVEPSLAAQRSLIPARSHAVRAYERMKADLHGPVTVRTLAAAIGLQDLLYPAALVLAEV